MPSRFLRNALFGWALAAGVTGAAQGPPQGAPPLVRPAIARPVPVDLVEDVALISCQPKHFRPDQRVRLDPGCRYSAFTSQRASNFRIPSSTSLRFTLHEFASAIEVTYALEARSGRAITLFTHIEQVEFDATGDHVALVRLVQSGTTWRRQVSVADVRRQRERLLGPSECTTHIGAFTSQGLITYGDEPVACLWTAGGYLRGVRSIPAMERSAEGHLPGQSLGLLADGGLVVVMPSRASQTRCDVLLSSRDGLTVREVAIDVAVLGLRHRLDQRACAAGVLNFDWTGVQADRGDVKYRFARSGQGWLRQDWSAWMTAR